MSSSLREAAHHWIKDRHTDTGFAALFVASLFVYLATQTRSLVDLRVYVGAIDSIRAGGALYDFHYGPGGIGFTYPPFAALLLMPLSMLPLQVAGVVMTAGGILSLFVIIRLTLHLAWPTRLDRRTAPLLTWRLTLGTAAVGLWLEPVLSTLRYGQVNLLIVTLILLDMVYGSPRLKGVGIGLAAGIKLTPAIFVAYLLITRRFRAATVAVATFAATVILGWITLADDSADYFLHAMFLDVNRVGRVEAGMNQSIRGGLARTLHTTNIEHFALIGFAVAGIAGLLIASHLACSGDEARGTLACALTGLLISPVSWSHHWVWSIPLLATLAIRTFHQPDRRAIGAMIVCFIVFASQTPLLVPGDNRAELRLTPPLVVLSLAYVLLGVALLSSWFFVSVRHRSSDDYVHHI